MRIPLLSDWLERRSSSAANPQQWLVDMFGGRSTASGAAVKEDNALKATAVYACVRILAETLASLPLAVYQRLDAGKERAPMHPLYSLLHDLPNTEMTSFTLRETLMAHLLLWGNAYAEIEWGRDGVPKALWPLTPNRVNVRRDTQTKLIVYDVNLPDSGGQVTLQAWQVLHIPGLGFDGIKGYSPITMAREAIGMALATEEFGARFFGNGTHLGGYLETDKALSERAYERLTKDMENDRGLPKAHRLKILEEGLHYNRIGIPPEDAQFLETRRFQLQEIARIYRVPPHMLADLERATFSNIEHQSIEFVVHTIRPWLVRWEQAINWKLFLPNERQKYFAEFVVDGLLRGDIKSRYEAYAIGRQNGWLSANDIRGLENMNPIANGDMYLVPLNMVPAEIVGKIQVDKAQPSQPPEPKPPPPSGNSRSLLEYRHQYESRAADLRRGLAKSYRVIFSDAVARVLRREEADVMRQAQKMLKRSTELFDSWLSEFYRDHEEFIRKTMSPAFVAYAEAVQAAAATEVGGDAGMSDELRKFVDDYLRVYIRRHTGSSVVQLREALQQAIAEGRNQLEALQETFDDWQETRPQEIAQEEAVRSGNAFAMTAYKLLGVTKVRWVATGKSCPYCQKLNGKVVGVDTAFIGKGEAFEADGEPATRDGKKDPPLIPSHDVKHPPAHRGCDCHIVADGVTRSAEDGNIRVTRVASGYYTTPPILQPNAVIDVLGRDGKVNKRDIYDDTGHSVKQINPNDHGNRNAHPYGKNGEHAHDFIWENGKIIDRPTRELTEVERKEHADILE